MKCTTDYRKEMARLRQEAEKAILQAFATAGEEAIKAIRATKTYQDVTGSLTASIGYGVFKDGGLAASGGFGGGEGGQAGEDLMRSLAAGRGLRLVIVAGMEYALYVERKGYVVLDGGTLNMERYVKDALKDVKIR